MEQVTLPAWLIAAIVAIVVSIVGGLVSILHAMMMARLRRIEESLETHGEQARDGIAEVHRRLDDHLDFHMERR